MVDRTKHIKVRHHFLPQKVEGAGEIVLTYYTPTGDQTMDALTKGLSHEKARKVLQGNGGVPLGLRGRVGDSAPSRAWTMFSLRLEVSVL